MLEKEILPARVQVGRQRRLTVVFDREGWSPKRFRRWAEEGITYRKGRTRPRGGVRPGPGPEAHAGRLAGGLSSGSATPGSARARGVKLREVRRLCDNRHQTSIVTTCRVPMEEVASRMFARWRQENFFRYMRLRARSPGHLCGDPQRLVPNPQRKAIEKELAPWRRQLIRLSIPGCRWENRAAQGRAPETPPTRLRLRERMEELEARIEQRQAHLCRRKCRSARGKTRPRSSGSLPSASS